MAYGSTNTNYISVTGTTISAVVADESPAINLGDFVTIAEGVGAYNAAKYTNGYIYEMAGIAVLSGSAGDIIQVRLVLGG